MKSLYAIDVGIGFTKRAYRQDEDSEIRPIATFAEG